MFSVFLESLLYGANQISEEIVLRKEAHDKLESAYNALRNMSSMDEQANRLQKLLRESADQISALCRMQSSMMEICYRYRNAENQIMDNAEGVRVQNERIIRRQHIQLIAVPAGIQVVRRL